MIVKIIYKPSYFIHCAIFNPPETNLIQTMETSVFWKRANVIDNLLRGFPSHEIDKIKNELEKLMKENVVIAVKKKHGEKVYINLEFRKEILKALKEEYPFI